MSTDFFSARFFAALISSETSNHFSLSEYFQDSYRTDYSFCSALPHEQCHKSVAVTSPFSYEMDKLDALCLLHTTKGSGKLFYEDKDGVTTGYDLTKDTLALIDCRKKHKLTCLHNIWEYTICFTDTRGLLYYLDKIQEMGSFLYRLDKYPDVFSAWEQVLRNTTDDEIHGILRARELVDLFTQLYLVHAAKQNGSYHIPSYINEIHRRFHTAYHEQYSLDELAAQYRINKFRLIREFTTYYECSPMQYLNKVRIDKAKALLQSTDEKIVDISRMVGIENTNHFIRLFKEKTGVTPLAYRRETPMFP